MSLWTIKWAEDDGLEWHVVPCDDEGRVIGGHRLRKNCQCGPRRDDEVPALIVHFDPERGGYNA